MTRKVKRLLEEIAKPENKTLAEAGKKAGYTSRQIYRKSTKKHIKKFLEMSGEDLEACKRKFRLVQLIAINEKDLSNVNRAIENEVRMQAGFKDTPIQQTSIIVVSKEEKQTLLNLQQRIRPQHIKDER